MTKIIDEYILSLTPQISKKTSKKTEKEIEKTFEKGAEKGTEKGTKKGGKKARKGLEKIFSRDFALNFGKKGLGNLLKFGGFGGLAGGAIAGGVLLGAKKLTDKATNVIEEQLNVADVLGTRASQAGISLEKFLKLQKLLEFSDVDAESASRSIIEFSKRLGDFQEFGAQKEVFSKLGITKNTSQEEAFLRAVSAIQNLSGSEKNITADKIFGGFGTEQLAEFLAGNLKEQSNFLKQIDFKKLAENVKKGGEEQQKITNATTLAATKKLEEINLSADPLITKIQNQTEREISAAEDIESIKKIVEVSEASNNILLKIEKASASTVSFLAEITEKFFSGNDNNKIKD